MLVRAEWETSKLAQLAEVIESEGAGDGEAELRGGVTGRHAFYASLARVQGPGEPAQLVVGHRGRAGGRQPPPQGASPEHHMPTTASRVTPPAPQDTLTHATRHHSPRVGSRLTDGRVAPRGQCSDATTCAWTLPSLVTQVLIIFAK